MTTKTFNFTLRNMKGPTKFLSAKKFLVTFNSFQDYNLHGLLKTLFSKKIFSTKIHSIILTKSCQETFNSYKILINFSTKKRVFSRNSFMIFGNVSQFTVSTFTNKVEARSHLISMDEALVFAPSFDNQNLVNLISF